MAGISRETGLPVDLAIAGQLAFRNCGYDSKYRSSEFRGERSIHGLALAVTVGIIAIFH